MNWISRRINNFFARLGGFKLSLNPNSVSWRRCRQFPREYGASHMRSINRQNLVMDLSKIA
jgi:hypothetical protein